MGVTPEARPIRTVDQRQSHPEQSARVYGRLYVFWPDGMLKTYPLSEPNVSVGRSSGNTIMLDTGTISRYHFTITNQDGQVILTDLDSVNGTYVDGVKLTT